MPKVQGAAQKTALNREEVVRQFGRKVRELRLARGLSQRTLAQKAGFSFSYATRLERGDAEPGLELVVRIAQALGATPHELIQAAPTDPWPELAAQARQRLNAILERQDRDALAVILPVLALAEDASARRRK